MPARLLFAFLYSSPQICQDKLPLTHCGTRFGTLQLSGTPTRRHGHVALSCGVRTGHVVNLFSGVPDGQLPFLSSARTTPFLYRSPPAHAIRHPMRHNFFQITLPSQVSYSDPWLRVLALQLDHLFSNPCHVFSP